MSLTWGDWNSDAPAVAAGNPADVIRPLGDNPPPAPGPNPVPSPNVTRPAPAGHPTPSHAPSAPKK